MSGAIPATARGAPRRGARAERVGRFHEVAARAADRDRHHQDDLEHGADEDHEELLRLADAGPQDQKRHEGGGGQVAGEGDERLHEGLHAFVGAHQDAERHGDEGGEDEAAEDAPDRDADVAEEPEAGEEGAAVASMVSGSARKVLDT